MNTISRISKYLFAYIAWILFVLLFLGIILLGRDTLLGFLRNIWAQQRFDRLFAISFIDRSFVLFLGILWLVLMIVLESYFRNGVVKHNLLHRVSKVFGYMALTIFLVHLFRTLISGVVAQSITVWLLLFVEFIISAGLLFLSQKTSKVTSQ